MRGYGNEEYNKEVTAGAGSHGGVSSDCVWPSGLMRSVVLFFIPTFRGKMLLPSSGLK
jgi:hypothetical protein